MTQPQGAFRRAPRPLIGWLWLLVGLASFGFLVLLSIPMLRAVNRWADGEPVDWVGFAAVASVAAGAMGQLIGQGMQWARDRRIQSVEEMRAGVAPPPPFGPSPPFAAPSPEPSPTDEGGLINNGALDQQ